MKKIIAIIFASFALVSCQKDAETDLNPEREKVYLQVEAVHEDGASVYSNIVLVR